MSPLLGRGVLDGLAWGLLGVEAVWLMEEVEDFEIGQDAVRAKSERKTKKRASMESAAARRVNRPRDADVRSMLFPPLRDMECCRGELGSVGA